MVLISVAAITITGFTLMRKLGITFSGPNKPFAKNDSFSTRAFRSVAYLAIATMVICAIAFPPLMPTVYVCYLMYVVAYFHHADQAGLLDESVATA